MIDEGPGSLSGGQGNPMMSGGPGLTSRQQQDESNQRTQYTMPGILHFLQTEWARFEMERSQWEVERAELQVKFHWRKKLLRLHLGLWYFPYDESRLVILNSSFTMRSRWQFFSLWSWPTSEIGALFARWFTSESCHLAVALFKMRIPSNKLFSSFLFVKGQDENDLNSIFPVTCALEHESACNIQL